MARWKKRCKECECWLPGVSDGLAVKSAKRPITYLETILVSWIGSYEHWRKKGYPVGSGMIERAVEYCDQSSHEEAGNALVQSQCHRHRRLAGGSAQRRLDCTSTIAGLSLSQPWVLGRTCINNDEERSQYRNNTSAVGREPRAFERIW